MSEPRNPQGEPSPYLRLPWPVIAGGLFIVLAAALAFGLFANRNLRPQGATAPTPGAPIAAAPTATRGPTVAPATDTPVPTRSTPGATPQVVASPTAVAATATSAPATTPAANGTSTG